MQKRELRRSAPTPSESGESLGRERPHHSVNRLASMVSPEVVRVLNFKQRVFLTVYAELGNVKAAAQAAKVARRSHYYWLEQPEYAVAFASVREVAVECLEPEVRHRAVEGVEEPVIYRGKLCYQKDLDPETGEMRTTGKLLTTRRYSDTLLIFLLKAERPDKYHRWQGDDLRPVAALPRPDLKRLSKEQLKQLKELGRVAYAGQAPTGS